MPDEVVRWEARMMPGSGPAAREIANRFVERYNALDVEGLLGCYSDDVEFAAHPGGWAVSGKEELRGLAKASAAAFSRREIRPLVWIVEGAKVCVECRFSAVTAAELADGTPAGATVEKPGCAVFVVRDDRIVRHVEYG